jgi:hypothetical protein
MPRFAERLERELLVEYLEALSLQNKDPCLPEHLHLFSRQYLDAFLAGHISRAQFLRGFPLPNSDHLPVEDCIIAAIDTATEAELAAPAPR